MQVARDGVIKNDMQKLLNPNLCEITYETVTL